MVPFVGQSSPVVVRRRQAQTGRRIVLSHFYAWPEVRRGGERYLHELGSALSDAGHQVTIVSTAPTAGRRIELGVDVRLLPRRRGPAIRAIGMGAEGAFAAEVLARLVRRPPDVWHALGVADGAAAASLGALRPTTSVYTSLGLPWSWYWEGRPGARAHRHVVDRVDRYVCLSATAATALDSFGRSADVVPGGVDTQRFVPRGRRHDRPALLFSGRLDVPRKQLSLLLDAVDILAPRVPDLELWLSGPGDPGPLVRAASPAVRSATVHLGLGRSTDLAEQYGRAWATVLPSVHEAFGLTLVESLSCGTPVVARRDGGGAAEVVEEGIGFLAESSAADLADACERALDLAWRPGTVDGCRAVALGYDWRRAIVPRMERVYG